MGVGDQVGGPDDFSIRCAARLVEAVFDFDRDMLLAPDKGSPAMTHARHILSYLVYTDGPEITVKALARKLGRDRSTVSDSIAIALCYRQDTQVDEALARLGDIYRQLLAAHDYLPALVEELAA